MFKYVFRYILCLDKNFDVSKKSKRLVIQKGEVLATQYKSAMGKCWNTMSYIICLGHTATQYLFIYIEQSMMSYNYFVPFIYDFGNNGSRIHSDCLQASPIGHTTTFAATLYLMQKLVVLIDCLQASKKFILISVGLLISNLLYSCFSDC